MMLLGSESNKSTCIILWQYSAKLEGGRGGGLILGVENPRFPPSV